LSSVKNVRLVSQKFYESLKSNLSWERIVKSDPTYQFIDWELFKSNENRNHLNYELLLKDILLGLLGVSCQLLSSLNGRLMSAYDCVVFYNPKFWLCSLGESDIHIDNGDEQRFRMAPDDIKNHNNFLPYLAKEVKVFKEFEEVEIQWKRNVDSPFGWWRGFIEEIEVDYITVFFPHFKKQSNWYRVKVKKNR